MAPQLVALTDGPNIPLDKPIVLIGRHQECDIQIPSRKISRRHCCIAQVNDHLVVRDLGSTNGIRVNGVRVLEGLLNTGDELVIGNFKYEVRMTAPVPAPQPKPPKKAAIGAFPKMELEASRRTDDSGDEPVAIEEGIKPVNRPNPPPAQPPAPAPIPQVISNMGDIPLALFPESMSLEPISEEYPIPKDLPGAPNPG